MSDLPTKLLEAGACYDKQGFVQCALNPSECGPIAGGAYRTSRWLAQNAPSRWKTCGLQESIRGLRAMGRCDASTDQICTSDTSACQLPTGWKALDPGCTVVEDLEGRTWDESYFGECLDRSNDDADFCAWRAGDCPDEGYRFQWANPFVANSAPDCRCDNVKTGACVSEDEADQGDGFFCAATPGVCDAGFSYLRPLEVESLMGVTCKLCGELPPPLEEGLVTAGVCTHLDGSFQKCALTPAHCGSNEEILFMSTASILDPNWMTPPEADACATPEGTMGVGLGRCDAPSNFRMCAPDATACNLAQTFRAEDPLCTVAFDGGADPSVDGFTHSGFCSFDDEANGVFNEEDSTCVWRRGDCTSSDGRARAMTYYDANLGISAMELACRCDRVRTGACVNMADPSRRHCAVQEDACDAGWEFVGWRDLTGRGMACRLCAGLPDAAPTTAPGTAVPADAAPAPPAVPLASTTAPGPLPIATDGGGLSDGAVAGIVVAALGVFLLLVFALHLVVRSPLRLARVCRREEEEFPRPLRRTLVDVLGDMEPSQTTEDFVPHEDHSVD